MRVFLDNNVIIDSWTDSQEHTVTQRCLRQRWRARSEGRVLRRRRRGRGQVQLAADPTRRQPAGSGGGQFFPNWKAEYFNNTSLAGAPALVRDDRYLNHNWGSGSPASGVIGNDNFSARWTKTLSGAPGNDHITMTSDDGARLYVNNQLIIDNWGVQACRTRSADYLLHRRHRYRCGWSISNKPGNASIDVHLAGRRTTPAVLPAPRAASCGQLPSAVGQTAYVNVSSLNFRDGPAVQFPVLATLPNVRRVQLTGYRNPVDASSPWVQTILPDGRTAWANADYLVMGVPLSQMTVLSD